MDHTLLLPDDCIAMRENVSVKTVREYANTEESRKRSFLERENTRREPTFSLLVLRYLFWRHTPRKSINKMERVRRNTRSLCARTLAFANPTLERRREVRTVDGEDRGGEGRDGGATGGKRVQVNATSRTARNRVHNADRARVYTK